MNKTTNAAFNGLNYVSAFKAAFAEQNIRERVSIEHMETFFFMVTARTHNAAIEMRRLQKALNYAQAKMHRTAATLEALGWIEITASAEDARQKEVALTASADEFFGKLGQFLSTEERTSTFKKRSREMQEEIKEAAQLREAVRNLYVHGDAADRDAIAKEAELERLTQSNAEIKENAFGVLHKANQEISERNERKKSMNERLKERRIEQATFRKQQDAARMRLRDVLMSRGETCEIGEKYIKTKRGIVTFPVLMKRTKATDLKTLAIMLEMLNAEDFDREMTPNPKSKIDRLKSELNSVLDRGWGAIEGNPHLFQRAHVLQSQIAAEEAKLDAKLGGGLGSLVGTNPVTKDAWMAVVEEKAKKRNSRGLMDPQRWEEEGE